MYNTINRQKIFNHAAAIGADIGRFLLKIAVVKIGGEIVAVKSYPLNQKHSRDYLITKLLKAIREIRQTVASIGINPICVGTAAKGFIDHKSGIVLGPDQGIKNWKNMPLAEKTNEESGLPVYIDNDANIMNKLITATLGLLVLLGCSQTSDRPISTSTLYNGDHNINDQFRNRDYRLYYTVCPPYKVNKPGPNATTWSYTGVAADREYIDLMSTISGTTYHTLPSSNFRNYYTYLQPHFKNNNLGQGWNATQMGFWVWKYYNTHTDASAASGVNTTDAPIFRIEEVMLNYAEAMAEQGKFDQAAADITINRLRSRVNVAAMVVAAIDGAFDTSRDPLVPALLWEIRRERRVELMGEGFRFNDLRRWKKGEYVNKQPLGIWLNKASATLNKVKITAGADGGYVFFFDIPKGWKDFYYLYPLPLNQLALNTNLTQNPGWE